MCFSVIHLHAFVLSLLCPFHSCTEFGRFTCARFHIFVLLNFCFMSWKICFIIVDSILFSLCNMSYVVAEMMISETINVIVCQIRFGSIFGRGAHTNTLIYIVYNEQNTDMSIKYRLERFNKLIDCYARFRSSCSNSLAVTSIISSGLYFVFNRHAFTEIRMRIFL